MKTTLFLAAAVLCLLCGCISYEYQGTKLSTPSATAVIYTDPSQLVLDDYTVLGTAVASGNTFNISQNDIYRKLSIKARECGADVILITFCQITAIAQSRKGTVNANFDSSDSNTSWQIIGRDVDNNYGNIRGISNEDVSAGSYQRTIKAQFLKLKTDKK